MLLDLLNSTAGHQHHHGHRCLCSYASHLHLARKKVPCTAAHGRAFALMFGTCVQLQDALGPVDVHCMQVSAQGLASSCIAVHNHPAVVMYPLLHLPGSVHLIGRHGSIRLLSMCCDDHMGTFQGKVLGCLIACVDLQCMQQISGCDQHVYRRKR